MWKLYSSPAWTNIVYYLFLFGCDRTLINSHVVQTITYLIQQFISKFRRNVSKWCIYALWRHLVSAFQAYQMPGNTQVYLRPLLLWGDMRQKNICCGVIAPAWVLELCSLILSDNLRSWNGNLSLDALESSFLMYQIEIARLAISPFINFSF